MKRKRTFVVLKFLFDMLQEDSYINLVFNGKFYNPIRFMDHRIMVKFGYWFRFWSVPSFCCVRKIWWLGFNQLFGSIFGQSHRGTNKRIELYTK